MNAFVDNDQRGNNIYYNLHKAIVINPLDRV